MSDSDGGLYAGFWRRGAAIFLDSLILIIPGVAISFVADGKIGLALNVIVGAAYYGGFHSSSRQATPGKRAFGIKVTNYAGERISLARGILRYFYTWLSALILMIGYLMASFTSMKQALHDMIAGTVVVNANATPAQIAARRGGSMPITLGVVLMDALFLLLPVGGVVAAIAAPSLGNFFR
jgi:uncharacterized RDD family membrane protein YckC